MKTLEFIHSFVKKFYYLNRLFISNCRRIRYMTSNATDDVSAKRLWDLSCQMVQIDPNLRLSQ